MISFQNKELANLFFFFLNAYFLGLCYAVDLCSNISVLHVLSNPSSATQKWSSFIMASFLGSNPTKSLAYGNVDGMTHMHKIKLVFN